MRHRFQFHGIAGGGLAADCRRQQRQTTVGLSEATVGKFTPVNICLAALTLRLQKATSV
jgi:hypothetical protein